MFGFGTMDPFELVIIATILAIVISDDREVDDLFELGNFIGLLGVLLQTIAGQKEILEKEQGTKDSKEAIMSQIRDLHDKYSKLGKRKK